MIYTIDFADSVKTHLKKLTARQRSRVFDAIEEQLTYEPLTETKNRKFLRPNPIAPWELRVDNLRVFYEVSKSKPTVVQILAVGIKKGNQLFIGNEEIKL